MNNFPYHFDTEAPRPVYTGTSTHAIASDLQEFTMKTKAEGLKWFCIWFKPLKGRTSISKDRGSFPAQKETKTHLVVSSGKKQVIRHQENCTIFGLKEKERQKIDTDTKIVTFF